jgi:hypothetical protein
LVKQCGKHYTNDTVILIPQSREKDLWSIWFVTSYNDPRFFALLRMTTAMERTNRSPRILHVSWGRPEVEGKAEPYKDAKLFPGGSCEWNWRETGTAHKPGIQVIDVQELLDHGAKVVVCRVEWPSAFTFHARHSIFLGNGKSLCMYCRRSMLWRFTTSSLKTRRLAACSIRRAENE